MNVSPIRAVGCASFFLLTSWAVGQSVFTPGVGSSLRKQILDAFRPRVEKTVGVAVVFKPFTFNVWNGWAFVIAQPVHPNGNSIDYRKTRLRREYAANKENWSDEVEGLLHKTSRGWKLLHFRYDFSDFDGEQVVEKYGVPEALVKAPN